MPTGPQRTIFKVQRGVDAKLESLKGLEIQLQGLLDDPDVWKGLDPALVEAPSKVKIQDAIKQARELGTVLSTDVAATLQMLQEHHLSR